MAHGAELMGRIALAAVFGYLIGLERELRGKPAGERTFALVALGAAAFMVAAVDRFPNPDRVLQGVATGVGFLGAGLVLRGERGNVQYLTTAATIWPAAAIGVLVGIGDLALGFGTTLLVLLMLEFEHIPVLGRLKKLPHEQARSDRPGPTPAE